MDALAKTYLIQNLLKVKNLELTRKECDFIIRIVKLIEAKNEKANIADLSKLLTDNKSAFPNDEK